MAKLPNTNRNHQTKSNESTLKEVAHCRGIDLIDSEEDTGSNGGQNREKREEDAKLVYLQYHLFAYSESDCFQEYLLYEALFFQLFKNSHHNYLQNCNQLLKKQLPFLLRASIAAKDQAPVIAVPTDTSVL